MIIIPLWIKIIQFHFIPPKYENHNHGMIFKSMKFILKRDDYYTFVFAVYEVYYIIMADGLVLQKLLLILMISSCSVALESISIVNAASVGPVSTRLV